MSDEITTVQHACRGCRLQCHERPSVNVDAAGFNQAVAILFGVPFLCVATLVVVYQKFWGAGGELAMLGVVLAGVAAAGIVIAPMHDRLIDRMSIRVNPIDEPS